MSYFTAKALSAEEEDKLDSEQKQAYVNEKAEEVERLQRIADEATDAARRGRVSRQRRESLPVSESAEWALKISRSVFAGSSTDRERLNRRMDQEDMCTARDMFEQLVNDAWCRKWLGDPHVLWHGCPLPFNEMSLTDGHPCLLPGEDHRIWASAGPLGAQSMFVHVQKEKTVRTEHQFRTDACVECVTAVGIPLLHSSWTTFHRSNVGTPVSEQFIYVSTATAVPPILLSGAIILEVHANQRGARIIQAGKPLKQAGKWDPGVYNIANSKVATQDARVANSKCAGIEVSVANLRSSWTPTGRATVMANVWVEFSSKKAALEGTGYFGGFWSKRNSNARESFWDQVKLAEEIIQAQDFYNGGTRIPWVVRMSAISDEECVLSSRRCFAISGREPTVTQPTKLDLVGKWVAIEYNDDGAAAVTPQKVLHNGLIKAYDDNLDSYLISWEVGGEEWIGDLKDDEYAILGLKGSTEPEPLNVVQAWFDEDDCPCIVTDDDTDKIDYPDFQNAWNYEGHDCPNSRLIFSRLIQQIERPGGGGTVEKVTGNMEPYTARYGTRNNGRARPFKYVAWAQ